MTVSKRSTLKSRRKTPAARRKFKTHSNLEIKRVFDASDTKTGLKLRLSEPGAFPFTRGIHSEMYRARLWTMRQYAGFGTAAETNERYKFLLSQGTSGLSVAFDLPTQMGYDPDSDEARGEVGKVGVSISTLDDMRILLKDIPLDKVSISMTINSTAAILLAMLLAVAKEQGVPWKMLRGTIQNDILKEYIARGTYIYPPSRALKLVTDIFSFCKKNVPKWNTISISGYHMREAGSNAVQELAFTFANAITYVEAALKSGLKVDEFAPRLAFFFNCHNEFFEEAAKFRAARRIWATIMKERFKARSPDSMKLRFHTQTAGSSLTAQQPINNIVRTTMQVMAAVAGGTQSLHSNSYDEALGLPTEESARVALRTQQIIAHESGMASTVDPLGGSYYVESLTDRIESEALGLIAKIDKMGGMLKAIELGFPQREIERSAYEYQRSIELNERIIVGVNAFAAKDEIPPEAQALEPKLERQRLAQVKKFKSARSKVILERLRAGIERGVEKERNLLPLILEAVEAHMTLGEISNILRGKLGEYHA